MHRFFIAPEGIAGEWAYIDPQQARHILVVLRMKIGDQVLLFDGQGNEYTVRLEATERDGLAARIIEVRGEDNAAGMRLYLIQSLAKGDKMDLIVQKATELGVAGIYPVISERSVVMLEGERARRKVDRWQSIAREACKQCRRSSVPPVHPVQTLESYLNCLRHWNDIMLYESQPDYSLKQILRHGSPPDEMGLIIGPEGGFSTREFELALDKGIKPAGLGPRILRTETAALVGLSIILYEYGELGDTDCRSR